MDLKLIGLSGKAGVGKDAVASELVARYGFVRISLADELKRFGMDVFGFTDEQLWGPSHCRNAVDHRFDSDDAWNRAEMALDEIEGGWCCFLFGPEREAEAVARLDGWFDALKSQYKGQLSPRIMLQLLGTEFGRALDPLVWTRAALNRAKKTGKSVVIPDCRFANEISAVQAAGGEVWRVTRPGATLVQVGVASHASEAEQDSIPDSTFDQVLVCPEGLENMAQALDKAMSAPTIVFCIVESPYAPFTKDDPVKAARELDRNEAYVNACMADSFARGEIPFASHAIYTRRHSGTKVLDDTIPEERKKGMQAGFDMAKALWAFATNFKKINGLPWAKVHFVRAFYTDRGWSSGMQAGLSESKDQAVSFREIDPTWNRKND